MPRYPNDYLQAGDDVEAPRNTNDYSFNPGVCVLPLAEDPPTSVLELKTWSPVVVLRLHAPYRMRKFTQAVGKQSNPSPIAAPGDTGAFTFIGGSVAVSNSLSTTYQDLNWAVAAEYLYVENCTSQDLSGDPLGLVLGKLPFDSILDRYNETFGTQPPSFGAVSLGGRATIAGYYAGQSILGPGNTGELKQSWSYNAQSLYPATLFYTDLPNGGKPVSQGG